MVSCFPLIVRAAGPWGTHICIPGVLSLSLMGRERPGTGCQAPFCSHVPGDPEAPGVSGVCVSP